MFKQMIEGNIRFEKCGMPKHLRAIVDPTVLGCSFIMRISPIILNKMTTIVFGNGSQIPTLVTVAETIVGDVKYWLLYYCFGTVDFYAWVEQSLASCETVVKYAKNCHSLTLQASTDHKWMNDLYSVTLDESLGLYLEDKIPGMRVLEYGELPNGILASFLITNPDEILGVFLGNKAVKDIVEVGSEVNDGLSQPRKQKPKPVSVKMKAKQEKRLKNWNQSKKKTDSQ